MHNSLSLINLLTIDDIVGEIRQTLGASASVPLHWLQKPWLHQNPRTRRFGDGGGRLDGSKSRRAENDAGFDATIAKSTGQKLGRVLSDVGDRRVELVQVRVKNRVFWDVYVGWVHLKMR